MLVSVFVESELFHTILYKPFSSGSISVSVSGSVDKPLKFNIVSVVTVTLKDRMGLQPIHHVS